MTAFAGRTILAVAWMLYVGRFWLTPPAPLTSSDDGVLYLAAALHLRDPGLFGGDWTFQIMAPIMEPLLYTRLLSWLWPWWDSPEALFRALSAALIGAFALGVFTLVRALTGRVPVALLAGLVSLRPRMALVIEWGILMGQPLPRSVVMAATPWLLLWIWRTRGRPWHLALPGMTIGLSALVHPISAVHLAMLVVLQELFMRSSLRAVASLAAGIAVGVLPALAHHGFLLTDHPAPTWFVRFRSPELLPSRVQAVIGPLVYDFGVPLLLLALAFRASRVWLEPKVVRWVCAGMTAALIPTLASLLAPLAPALARFALGRPSGFLYLFLSVPVLTVAWATWTAGGASRLAAVGLAGALALSTGAWWDARLDRAFAGAGIALGNRASWNRGGAPAPLPPAAASGRGRGPDVFREMADWSRMHTPRTALLLADPGEAAALRLYGQRGIVVATKDAGFFVHSAAIATAWYARFGEVATAYASGDSGSLTAVARRYGATHIVADAARPPMPLPPLFANGRYVVYGVDERP